MRGGFTGGLRTNYRSFFPPRFVKTPTYDEYPDHESRDQDNYQSQSYFNDKYYKKRPESIYKGNIFDFIIFIFCIEFMCCKEENSRLNTNIQVDRQF